MNANTKVKIDKLYDKLSDESSIIDYKKYALAVIDAEKNDEFGSRNGEALHQTEAGLVLNPLVKFDFKKNQKLEQIETLGSLLDVPPLHDSGIDREKSWLKIVAIVNHL